MRYPRYKPETILKLRNSGPVQKPDGRVRQHIYHDSQPPNDSQHATHRGIYRWGAALTIPFAIAYGTESVGNAAEEKRLKEEKRKQMIMKSMKR